MKQFLKQHGKNILCIICVMMVVLSFSAGCSFGNKTATERIEDKADKINDLIKTYYLNDVDEENVEENIYKGILNGLDDPYSVYYTADEYADLMNRTYNNWEKKAARAKASQEGYESSYDVMVENGYDAKDDTNNPEEIIAYKTVINALTNALDELTDEKLRACKMVANGESQREVAEELGISRRTLRDRKDSAMKELGDKLKDYK